MDSPPIPQVQSCESHTCSEGGSQVVDSCRYKQSTGMGSCSHQVTMRHTCMVLALVDKVLKQCA
jgi:hypothetical protein